MDPLTTAEIAQALGDVVSILTDHEGRLRRLEETDTSEPEEVDDTRYDVTVSMKGHGDFDDLVEYTGVIDVVVTEGEQFLLLVQDDGVVFLPRENVRALQMTEVKEEQ